MSWDEDVSAAVYAAGALFRVKVEPLELDGWLKSLEGLPADAIVAAFERLSRESDYWPKPAAVRRSVEKYGVAEQEVPDYVPRLADLRPKEPGKRFWDAKRSRWELVASAEVAERSVAFMRAALARDHARAAELAEQLHELRPHDGWDALAHEQLGRVKPMARMPMAVSGG